MLNPSLHEILFILHHSAESNPLSPISSFTCSCLKSKNISPLPLFSCSCPKTLLSQDYSRNQVKFHPVYCQGGTTCNPLTSAPFDPCSFLITKLSLKERNSEMCCHMLTFVSIHTDVRGGVREDDRPAGPNEPRSQVHHGSGRQSVQASQICWLPQEGHGDCSEGPGQEDLVHFSPLVYLVKTAQILITQWWFMLLCIQLMKAIETWLFDQLVLILLFEMTEH